MPPAKRARATKPPDDRGPVERATAAYLKTLPADLAGSPLAASALAMAQGLDGPSSLTSRTMAAKAHQDLLREVRSLAPAKETHDGLDDELARRRARLAGTAASTVERGS
jgi:hypothetical protein